jgi:hypothetical protein
MIFTAKKKTGKSVIKENPRPPRYISIARVGINGFEGEAVLRNISTGGFRMESRTYAAIGVGDHYTMQIKPEAASSLRPFELEIEVRWIQSTETRFNSGLLVIKPPIDRSFEKYVDYIKTRN